MVDKLKTFFAKLGSGSDAPVEEERVLEHLAAAGIGRERFSAVGYGERRPLADNTTREGRARNRRVELSPR